MKYGTVTGVKKDISRLVQGTVMLSPEHQDEDFALLDAIYELGCNTFDTAHGYGRGQCERSLGAWIQARGLREKVVILDKGAHPYDGVTRVKPEYITSDLHESLERLGTDYIDLYILHRDDPEVPVGEIVDVLNEHHQAGRIHAFGGSNWTYQRIREANEYAQKNLLTPFVASSPQFSLVEMVKEPWGGCLSIGGNQGKEAREWYQEQQMPLFTWSSLAGGFLTGKFTRDNLNSFDNGLDESTIHAYAYEENFQRLDHLRQLAEEKDVSLPRLALAYCLSYPLVIFQLVGCRSGEEFADNKKALDIELTAEEIAFLEN